MPAFLIVSGWLVIFVGVLAYACYGIARSTIREIRFYYGLLVSEYAAAQDFVSTVNEGARTDVVDAS